VSTTTTLAILTAAQLGQVVPNGNPAALLKASATLTLLVGAALLLACLLRLGTVANFISEPVLVGFRVGIGLVIVVDQIPKIRVQVAAVAQAGIARAARVAGIEELALLKPRFCRTMSRYLVSGPDFHLSAVLSFFMDKTRSTPAKGGQPMKHTPAHAFADEASASFALHPVIPTDKGLFQFKPEECSLKTQIRIVPNQKVPPPIQISLDFDNPSQK
jgi:Sulfate permease family